MYPRANLDRAHINWFQFQIEKTPDHFARISQILKHPSQERESPNMAYLPVYSKQTLECHAYCILVVHIIVPEIPIYLFYYNRLQVVKEEFYKEFPPTVLYKIGDFYPGPTRLAIPKDLAFLDASTSCLPLRPKLTSFAVTFVAVTTKGMLACMLIY